MAHLQHEVTQGLPKLHHPFCKPMPWWTIGTNRWWTHQLWCNPLNRVIWTLGCIKTANLWGSITLPVRSKQKKWWFLIHCIKSFFFFGFRRWSKPFSQQMLQWTYPEVTEQLLSFWLHRSGGQWAWWVWLIWWALRWVGGSHLEVTCGSQVFPMILEETSGPNIFNNDSWIIYNIQKWFMYLFWDIFHSGFMWVGVLWHWSKVNFAESASLQTCSTSGGTPSNCLHVASHLAWNSFQYCLELKHFHFSKQHAATCSEVEALWIGFIQWQKQVQWHPGFLLRMPRQTSSWVEMMGVLRWCLLHRKVTWRLRSSLGCKFDDLCSCLQWAHP